MHSTDHLGAPIGPYLSDDQRRGDAGIGAYLERIKAGELIGAMHLGSQRRIPDAPAAGKGRPPAPPGALLGGVFADLEWAEQASCAKQLDRADEFHVPQAGPHMPAAIPALAAEFCAGCPVIAECAADADRHRARGLWGGSYRAGHKPSEYVVRRLVDRAPVRELATAAVPNPAAVAPPTTTTNTRKEPAA